MTNKTIEELAINSIKKSILTTEYLDQFIAENDKEPSWDGTVYVYGDKKKRKSDLIGRVAVQVKGKVNDDFSADEISYSVSKIDMNNYLNDGGVIFFVVYLTADGDKVKIYFETLSPIKLKNYLAEAKGQFSKSITLRTWTDDKKRKETIFLNFHLDCNKQISFSNENISLEKLEKEGYLTSLNISVTGYGNTKSDIIKAFLENEVYIYANVKGYKTPVPIDLVPCYLQAKEVQKCVVSINDKKYYDSITRIHTKGKVDIKIGASLTIEIIENNCRSKIKYKSAPMLSDRIRDTEFIIDVIQAENFMLDSTNINFQPQGTDFERFNIEEQTESLEFCRKVQRLFQILNIQIDLNLEELTEQEFQELNKLIFAIVDKRPLLNIITNDFRIIKVKIQNIIILLVLKKISEKSNEYIIDDFSKVNFVLNYNKSGSKTEYITSKYSILNKEDYLSVSNLNYEDILQSYKFLIEENPEIYDMMNLDMLKIISAFDVNKDIKLLNLAKDIASWIMSNDEKVLPKELKLINFMQIIKRERQLNEDEIRKLIILVEDSQISEEIKVGAYLLLDNQVAAKIHLKKLDGNVQEEFKEYPIYIFMNQMEDI